MGNYIEYSVLTKFCGGQNLRGVVKGHFTKRLRGQWGLGTNLAGEGGGGGSAGPTAAFFFADQG